MAGIKSGSERSVSRATAKALKLANEERHALAASRKVAKRAFEHIKAARARAASTRD